MIIMGCSKICVWRFKFRLNYKHSTVVLRGKSRWCEFFGVYSLGSIANQVPHLVKEVGIVVYEHMVCHLSPKATF